MMTILDPYGYFFFLFFFFALKSENFHVFEVLCKRVQTKQDICISSMISNQDTKFKNKEFHMFCKVNV